MTSQSQQHGEKDVATAGGDYRGLLVSNHPPYLLARAATNGIETPKKIMTGSDIGHHYHLKPSDRRLIQDANVIFWIGEELEAPLTTLLVKHPKAKSILTQPAFQALSVRDVTGQPLQEGARDAHIWLDPQRAKEIVQAIAIQRSEVFPQYKKGYMKNSADFGERMDAVIEEVKQALPANQNNRKTHYIAYHDAYQYLEKPLNLKILGSLVATAEQPVTARQLVWLASQRRQVSATKPICVLAETSAVASRLDSLAPTTLTIIDESMQTAGDFVSGWRNLARQVQTCVSKS